MMSPYAVQQILHLGDMDENEISKRIIVPCLQKVSEQNKHFLRDIRFVGGEHEKGSDIEYYEIVGPDKLRFYTGIQVKKRNISISEATKLIIQGTQAFEKTIVDPSLGISYRINRWIVATTGEISPPAKEEIHKALIRYGKLISFWEGTVLGEFIVTNFYQEFIKVMQIEPPLADSENLMINLWDPNEPQVLLNDFASNEWTKVDISMAAPPTSTGILIKLAPVGHNRPTVQCLVRSSKDEVLLDSFLSQHQPGLLRVMPGEREIDIKLIGEARPVNVFSTGFAFER